MEFLAWPVVVLLLVMLFFLFFKKPISRLIDRTEKVSKEGLIAGHSQEQQGENQISQIDEVLKIHDSQLLVETEKTIKIMLDDLHPKDSEEKEKFLIRNLAQSIIAHAFDKTYYSIYGSQIQTLKYMNENRNIQLTTSDVQRFYDNAETSFPKIYSNYSFESWLKFLSLSTLIQKNDNEIAITIRGKEFLKYIIEQGYIIDKLG